jgi:hypothetical protein
MKSAFRSITLDRFETCIVESPFADRTLTYSILVCLTAYIKFLLVGLLLVLHLVK